MSNLRTWMAALLLLAVVAAARADLEALGISPSQPIYVQEYWSAGKPYYRIINFADKEIAIGLKDPDGKQTGPWKIPARASRSIPAPVSQSGTTGHVYFQRDGTTVGVMPPLINVSVPEEKGELTCMGYNGNGGQNQQVWMVQKESTYRGGDVVEMTFLLKGDGPEALRLTRAFEDRGPYGQLFLSPLSVTCDTLAVAKNPSEFVVTVANPKKAADWHRVVARFQAPPVRTMKAGVIMGSHSRQGGGSAVLARCVVLLPDAEAKKGAGDLNAEDADTAKLQGAWNCYTPRTTKGNLLLIHGNRIFLMPYEDDERVDPLLLLTSRSLGGEVFTLERQDGKQFIALRGGGRLEYRLEDRTLHLVRPADRKDIWGFTSICGEYHGSGR